MEVVGSFTETIQGDSHAIIKGERQEHIGGCFTQKKVAKDIDVFAANNHSTTANSSIFLNADENMTFDSYLNRCMGVRIQSL